MATRADIVSYCDTRLDAPNYQDIAINGLQVECAHEINRLAVAVSTSERTIRAAIDWNADALLVHHGLFWGGAPRPLTGMLGRRLKLLFQHDINLIGYHLPLDGHPELGNNALLVRQLALEPDGRFGEVAGMPLGVVGVCRKPLKLPELLERIADLLDRQPTAVGATDLDRQIERVGVLSGSGYGTLDEIAALRCQALVTGDLREPTMAEARELGIVAIAAGHEATERSGVQALAAELAQHFGIETRFFADPNPI